MSTNEIPEVVFSDIDFNFKPHPVTKDVPMLTNVAAVKRSFRNLVLTNFAEKPFQPSIFSGVLSSLFENFDPILVSKLQSQIKIVAQYEPRVKVIEVLVSNYEELDRNGINITINFRIVNRVRVESVNIFLERVR